MNEGKKELLKNKPVLFFLLKAVLIFGLFVLPLKIYDISYGKFYRGVCKGLFSRIQETGFAKFTAAKTSSVMNIQIGNILQRKNNGMVQTASSDVNIRYRGFLPTMFLLSLILASPLSRKRKALGSLLGIIILTAFIMIKQWIHILYMCEQKSWLALYNFTPDEGKKIEFLFYNFANFNGSTLVFAIAVWLLVSFRKSDFVVIRA